MKLTSVLKHDHVAECFALERDTPWCLDYKNPHTMADKNGGGRGRTTSWIRVRCLNPDCPASMLVREWEIWALAEKSLT